MMPLKPPPQGYRYVDLTCNDCRKYIRFGGKCIGSTHIEGEKPKCPLLQHKIMIKI